jgi:Tol biopolymer transport system component
LELYFHSDRPGGNGDYDLWMTTRHTTNEPWGEPINLGSTVNSSARENSPSISVDGLTLYFASKRPGGSGNFDIWVTTRATKEDSWEAPVNLGVVVNSNVHDRHVNISASELELYFTSARSGGYGNDDLWVTTRATKEEPWGEAVNLGPTVNTSAFDRRSTISANGLVLFFDSSRSGGYGGNDMWMTTRPTTSDAWTQPLNLGPEVNGPSSDSTPCISANGSTLYFSSYRPGGLGDGDIWQVSLKPVIDLNSDGIVDAADMCIIVDYWGTDEPLCDIGPMPWGDGIVDVENLIVLAEHLFEEFPPAE